MTDLMSSPKDWLRLLASLLIVGSIATSLAYRNELFNVALIVMAISLSIWNRGRVAEGPNKAVRAWSFALVGSAIVWALSIHGTFDSELTDYEKPLKYIVCALVAAQLIKLAVPLRVLFFGAIFAAALTGIHAFGQSYQRLELGMNAGTAAYQLCIVFGLISSYLLFKKRISILSLGVGLLGLGVTGWLILETQTRGAWVVLFSYLLAFTVVRFRDSSAHHKFGFGVAVALVLGAVILLFNQSNSLDRRWNQAVSDVEQIKQGNLTGSIGRRVAMLHVGYYAVTNPTLLGYGENSLANLKRYLAEMENGERYQFLLSNLHFHNQYLDQFTKRGVLGLLFYLLFLLAPIFLVRRETLPYALAVALPLLVGGFIETPFNNSNFITSYILYMTFVLATQRKGLSDATKSMGRNL